MKPMDESPAGRAASPSAERLQRLGRFLALDSANTTLLRDYAFEALRAAEFEACAGAVCRLIEAGESEADDLMVLGTALRRAGRAADALDALRSGVERWPSEAGLATELARCLFATGDLEGALAALPARCEDAPSAAQACELRVRLLHHLGRLDDALAAAAEFALAFGENAGVEATALPVLVDQSRVDEAAQRAGEIVARIEKSSDPRAEVPYDVAEALALAAIDARRPAEALSWTRQALARRSDDGRIWLVEGTALLQAGQLPRAVEALERAVELMPAHAGSHLALGWTRLLLGERASARRAFEHAVDASPGFAEGHGSLAVIEALEANAPASRELIRKARLLDRHGAAGRFAIALLEGRTGDDIARLAASVLSRARTWRGG